VHDDGFFDEDIATDYDRRSPEMFDEAILGPAVDFLAELANGGRVLELGIGTGRVALPLAAKGLSVHGIDLSRSMVERLREKPGGESIGISIGDFSSTTVEGTFKLAYLVFNTIMNLTTQEAQIACFRNVSSHLDLGGRFVIEVMLPELQSLPFGETIRPYNVTETQWNFDEYDIVHQGLISHHCIVEGGKVTHQSIPFRYVWPSELDLMAEMAGMQLRERWTNWSREPFTNLSSGHVSVWEKVR